MPRQSASGREIRRSGECGAPATACSRRCSRRCIRRPNGSARRTGWRGWRNRSTTCSPSRDLPFRLIGPESDYFGLVAPYQMDLQEFDRVILSGQFPGLDTFVDRPRTRVLPRSRTTSAAGRRTDLGPASDRSRRAGCDDRSAGQTSTRRCSASRPKCCCCAEFQSGGRRRCRPIGRCSKSTASPSNRSRDLRVVLAAVARCCRTPTRSSRFPLDQTQRRRSPARRRRRAHELGTRRPIFVRRDQPEAGGGRAPSSSIAPSTPPSASPRARPWRSTVCRWA